MSKREHEEFPELAQPPIVEVVCGIVFDAVPELDALMLGVYWDERKQEFPRRQLQPALTDEPRFALGTLPMRAFLASGDDQFVLQLQYDRFFMNWRASGEAYPRFSERHGSRGLLVRMQDEWVKFQDFVQRRCARELIPRRIELSKIDLLQKGRHWKDVEELSRVLPVTGVFQGIQRAETRDVNLQFVEKAADGIAIVNVATVGDSEGGEAVRVDARFVTDPVPSIAAAFERGDEVLNQAFFKLIPEAKQRFGIKGELR
jgi:uncharacterized protein (TIGR04255 family)